MSAEQNAPRTSEGWSILPAVSTEFVSAWKSVPGFIRFAVWLWALAMVLGTVLGVIFGLAAVAGGAALLGG